MHEHHDLIGLLGIKVANVAAGFAGGLATLSFLRGLNKFQGFLAVLTGTLCASYLTQPFLAVSQKYGGDMLPELSVAFLVGLCGMNIVPGVLKLSETLPVVIKGVMGRKGEGK
jgi:hypothetical protein